MPSDKTFQNTQPPTDSIAHKDRAFESIVFTKDTGYIYKSSDEIPVHKQIFSELSYEPQEIIIPKNDQSNNFADNSLLSIIFLGFVIMAVIRNALNIGLHFPMLRMLQFKSSINKETRSTGKIIEASFYMMFFIALSLFSTQLIEYFDMYLFGFSPNTLGLLASSAILISVAVFKFINRIFFFVFEDISFLQYNKTLDVHITGISIPLFLIASAQYPVSGILNEVFLYAGLSLLFLSYLIKITKFIYINYSNKLRFYYLFLYLCALEAVPLLIVIKLYTAQ